MSNDARSTGFWHSIPGILTAGTGILTAGAGLIVALSEAGVLGGASKKQPADSAAVSAQQAAVTPVTSTQQAAPSPIPINGRWSAQVVYPWGLSLEEKFVFRVEDGRVIGSATYLGVARTIMEGKIVGDRVTFFTNAQEILGSTTTDYRNNYDGLITIRGIQFVLQDTRGVGAPIEFAARKTD